MDFEARVDLRERRARCANSDRGAEEGAELAVDAEPCEPQGSDGVIELIDYL